MFVKKIISIWMSVCFLMMPLVVLAQSAVDQKEFNFSDVPIAHDNFEAIQWLAQQGVIKGYDDGTFGVDKVVNRVEFLKMVYLIQGLGDKVLVTELSQDFPDVDLNAWYAPYVSFAKKVGTVEGYPDNTFRPGDGVNRAEALKIVLKEFYPQGVPPTIADLPYVEALDIDAWYYPYLVHGFTRCLFDRVHETVNDDGMIIYDLDGGMTRKEVAELLYRTKALIDSKRIDLCDSEFEAPGDVGVTVEHAILERGSVFFADFENSDGYRFWGDVRVKSVHFDKVENKLAGELLFSTVQADGKDRTYFVPNKAGDKLLSLLPVESKSNDPTQVVISDVDGKYKLKLFENGAITGAAWSDDGNFVAWVSWSDSGQRLYWYRLNDPLDKVNSIELDQKFYYRFLGWTGNRLFVVRAMEGTEDPGDIGYYSFESGENFLPKFQQLFKNSSKSDLNLKLSEDGSKIVYSEHGNDSLGPIEGPYRLVYRDLSNPSNEIEVAKSDRQFHSPIWTRDTKYLMYENGGMLWKLELATRKEVPLLNVDLINQQAGLDHSLKPLFVSGDGLRAVVMAEVNASNFDGVASLYLIETTKEAKTSEDVVLLESKLHIAEGNIAWID